MEVSIQSNHSVIITDYNKHPQWVPHKLRELGESDVLIQVQASTINPSDLLSIEGFLPEMTVLPYAGGKQGVGKVIKTGDKAKQFQGKRVSFSDIYLSGGGWANFIVVPTNFIFVVDEDLPVSSAASGIINPITVLAMISEVKRRNINSIIHTAAASALGRMLSKICKTQGITLLNIVRRQQHADILKSEGAQHIIVTTGQWQEIYSTKIKELKSKLLFDALGGGDVQAKIINHLPGDAIVFVYGLLQGKDPSKPTTVNPTNLLSGLTISGFILSNWFLSLSKQEQKQLREKYNHYLKTDLSSTFAKQFKFSQIVEAIEEYKKNPSNGKILLRP